MPVGGDRQGRVKVGYNDRINHQTNRIMNIVQKEIDGVLDELEEELRIFLEEIYQDKNTFMSSSFMISNKLS